MKDVRGVAGTRSDGRKDGRKDGRNDGWNDGRTHGRTRVISIVPLRLRRVTKMPNYLIFIYLLAFKISCSAELSMKSGQGKKFVFFSLEPTHSSACGSK